LLLIHCLYRDNFIVLDNHVFPLKEHRQQITIAYFDVRPYTPQLSKQELDDKPRGSGLKFSVAQWVLKKCIRSWIAFQGDCHHGLQMCLLLFHNTFSDLIALVCG